uniref:Serine protease n=1 Tax=Candidatus Enterococcus mansonii TaxID=1834181 RepID=A0A242CDI6_9ENTE|nr:Ig-like domain-containing protein [Enterococcus sp. 4G2_DIV0659]OTO07980.1 hypothetical protein A5880_002250 [Enterococcus sp. 4G2_DIV0659]
MKNLMLGTAVFFGIFFLTPEIGKAESVYDFVEYDVKTKTERIIPFDESLYEGMPEFLEAKRPQGMPETRGIIGEDGRELVQDTTKFPFSAVAQLEHPNSIGSGALIQKNIFLTCAHAVYNNGFFSDGLIVPGRIGYWNKPFGEAKMEKIYILKEYMTDKQVGNDFALVKLDRPIGEKTGWLGLNYANKAGETFTISGYPGDKNFYMYTESQPIHETLRYEYGRHIFERVGWGKEALFYLLDSVGGQSGSPVYDSNAQISAVHNSGISLSRPIYNGGSRVSKEKFAMVNNIMNQIQKEYVPIEKIEIQQQDIILEQGDSIDLKVTVTPENATYKEIEWSEEKESAWWLPEHYVDPYGKLTGHRTGLGTVNLKVIAKSVDGGKIATSQVKVVQKKVTGISLTPEKVTLDIGDTQKLNYTIQPSNASNLAVSWSSTNNQVVSITNDGVMTGKAAGTAKIIVTTSDGNKTASSEITVNEPRVPVTGISVTPENKELFVGEKETLKATVTPENATNKKVKWSSSNEKIATVTDKGDVTAIAQGTATITAITEDGQKSAISKIKIVDNIGIEWTWDEASQTITFGAGKFPDQPYWRYNIQTHIESQSRLKGKKIKKIIFSQPVKLASSARELFSKLLELESIEGGNLLNTSTVKDMRGVFYNAPKLRSVDVSNWDTSQVTTMSNMFDGTLTLEKLNVSNWDTSQVTDMHHMFNNANKLESLDVSNWNTLSVKYTHSMFPNYLEQLKLGKNIRFNGDTGLKEVRTFPYSGRWVGPDGKTNPTIIYQTSKEFTQNYDGSKPGTYVRERTK